MLPLAHQRTFLGLHFKHRRTDLFSVLEKRFRVVPQGKQTIHCHAPVEELFFAEKKWGPQRKDFGGRYGFSGFLGFFVSSTGLESFSLRPEKVSKRFSFGGGSVCFFFSVPVPPLVPAPPGVELLKGFSAIATQGRNTKLALSCSSWQSNADHDIMS